MPLLAAIVRVPLRLPGPLATDSVTVELSVVTMFPNGSSTSITVDVEDPFGNIVTTDSSTVTLSVASGPGSLSGTLTMAASSGIATFSNVKLNTAGSYTLTTSDGSL